MEQAYYWNIHEEYHPKNRLLKYSKSSKISEEVLQILLKLRKTYHKLPPIIYSLRDREENKDIILEYDIFGQQCHLPLKSLQTTWQSTSFHVPDQIYQQIKRDLYSFQIDSESIFLCLFPIYADLNRKKQITMGRQDEEIYLPSKTPSTLHDLQQLQERFHRMLSKEEALEIGLCPKRRRIYDDLFDELIRIVTLHCSERGLLLARIKNEYLQWMNTYEELYSSGMAYGLRQYLHKIEEKQNYEYAVQELENECRQLQEELEKESVRFEDLSRLIVEDTEKDQNFERRLLKNNVHILRSTNEILRRDLQNTLESILLSTIFLGEPIDYDKEIN